MDETTSYDIASSRNKENIIVIDDKSIIYDLKYLHEGVEELSPYLLSNELFWPLNATPPEGGQPFPRLTLGNLYLKLAQLRAQLNGSNQFAQLWKYENNIVEIREKWRSAWIKKSSKEFRSRIKQWENYLNELRRDLEEHSPYYPYEVRLRVILKLLQPDSLDVEAPYIELLNGLDKILLALFVPNGFIWDEKLSDGFPRDVYWYLWGSIKEA